MAAHVPSGVPAALSAAIAYALLRFNAPQQSQTVQQWQDANDAERAVDELPVKRDLADRAADQCQRDHRDAGKDPGVEVRPCSERIDQRVDKERGNDDVAKGEPVRPVADPWILGVGVCQTMFDGKYPKHQPPVAFGAGSGADTQELGQEIQLPQQGKGRDATDDQADDEEDHESTELDKGRHGCGSLRMAFS